MRTVLLLLNKLPIKIFTFSIYDFDFADDDEDDVMKAQKHKRHKRQNRVQHKD